MLVQRFTMVMDCIQLGKDRDQFFLREDLTIQCWTSTWHQIYLATMAFPLFLCYVIGIPFMVYRILSSPDNRKLVEFAIDMTSIKDPAGQLKMQDPKFSLFMENNAFLFLGFRKEAYYWCVCTDCCGACSVLCAGDACVVIILPVPMPME